MGGMVFPPPPGFYHKPASIGEIVEYAGGRVIDLCGLEHGLAPRRGGMSASAHAG